MKAQKISHKQEDSQSVKALTEISGMTYLQKNILKQLLQIY